MELDFCNGDESNCYSFECYANQLGCFLEDFDPSPSIIQQIEQAEYELRQQQNDDYQYELKRHEKIEQEKNSIQDKIVEEQKEKKEKRGRRRVISEAEKEKNRIRTQQRRIQKRKLEEQLKEQPKEQPIKSKTGNIVVISEEQLREAALQRAIQEEIGKQKELIEMRRKLWNEQKRLLVIEQRIEQKNGQKVEQKVGQKKEQIAKQIKEQTIERVTERVEQIIDQKKRIVLIQYTKFECIYPDPITGDKCTQTARYGFEPRKPIYCRSHYRYGRRGIYNVFHNKCIDPNCFRSAFYGTVNPKQYIACRDHRDPSHVRFTLHLCQICDHAYDVNDRDCVCHPKKK